LAETNKTHSEDYYTDDYYNVVEVNTFPFWKIIAITVAGVLVGSFVGFSLAMRFSPKFNRRVRSSAMLRPMTSSRVFRKSFGNPIELGYTGLDIDN